MSRLSLRDRVTLATALVLAVGLALLTLAVNVMISNQLDADLTSRLRERADAALATVSLQHGRVVVRDAVDDAALDQQAWIFAGGRLVRRPEARSRAQRAAEQLANVRRATETTLGSGLRLRAEPVDAPDSHRHIATVVVGSSLAPYEHTERIALLGTLLLDVFVLAAGALLARRAVGKALQPVAEMTRRAAEWSEHDLDRRFDLGSPRDELTALSATLDRLLARIAASLRHEQRFSAEMAHELRTPLSGVRGEAELALRTAGGEPALREALAEVLRGTERMEAVIETLLSAARGDARAAHGSSGARAGAQRAVETARPLGTRSGVAVTLDAGRAVNGVKVGAEEDVVVQALGPLLENAVRHARSAVAVSVERERGDVLFRVRDDGAGIDPAEAGALFEPGRSGVGSAGLGLPLARRLARSCGGEVLADEPNGAGASFVLRLPALT
jgi:two-component system, OmpR family, sensor kinase